MGAKLWLQHKQIRIWEVIFDSYVGKTESLWIISYKQQYFPLLTSRWSLLLGNCLVFYSNKRTELRKKVLHQDLFASCYRFPVASGFTALSSENSGNRKPKVSGWISRDSGKT